MKSVKKFFVALVHSSEWQAANVSSTTTVSSQIGFFYFIFLFTCFHRCTQHTEEKHAFITQQCARLSDGIKKIDEASSQIDVLRVVVEEQRKNVLIAAENCEKMLQGIEKCKIVD